MTVGISVPLPAYTFDPAIITKKAEDLAFDSIWYAEHPAVPVKSVSPFPATGGEIPWTYSHFSDPYIALARASAVIHHQTGDRHHIGARTQSAAPRERNIRSRPTQRRALHLRDRYRLAEGRDGTHGR